MNDKEFENEFDSLISEEFEDEEESEEPLIKEEERVIEVERRSDSIITFDEKGTTKYSDDPSECTICEGKYNKHVSDQTGACFHCDHPPELWTYKERESTEEETKFQTLTHHLKDEKIEVVYKTLNKCMECEEEKMCCGETGNCYDCDLKDEKERSEQEGKELITDAIVEEEEEEEEEESLITEDIDDEKDIKEESLLQEDSELTSSLLDDIPDSQHNSSILDEPTLVPKPPIIVDEKGRVIHDGFEINLKRGKMPDQPKSIWMISGHKGEGKTVLALSFVNWGDGEVHVLSYDGKSQAIADYMFPGNKKIVVHNIMKYKKKGIGYAYRDSMEECYRYANAIIEVLRTRDNIDWIIFDCVQVLQKTCEQKMRKDNQLMTYETFGNLKLWEERSKHQEDLHDESYVDIVRKGLIYTSYIKEGVDIRKDKTKPKPIPQYIGNLKEVSDNVIFTYSNRDQSTGDLHFFADLKSCKMFLKTGSLIDVTGSNGISKILQKAGINEKIRNLIPKDKNNEK
jgi:hypothetical protein